MNTAHELTYLSGGDAYFGPDFGGAQVFTLARTGWAADCPNAAQFFKNLVFTVDMENEMMGMILDDGESRPTRRGLDQGEPRRARPLARRRHHLRRPARPAAVKAASASRPAKAHP